MSTSFFASQRLTTSKHTRTHLDHFLGNIAFTRRADVEDLAQWSERQAALSGLLRNQSNMPFGNSRTRHQRIHRTSVSLHSPWGVRIPRTVKGHIIIGCNVYYCLLLACSKPSGHSAWI